MITNGKEARDAGDVLVAATGSRTDVADKEEGLCSVLGIGNEGGEDKKQLASKDCSSRVPEDENKVLAAVEDQCLSGGLTVNKGRQNDHILSQRKQGRPKGSRNKKQVIGTLFVKEHGGLVSFGIELGEKAGLETVKPGWTDGSTIKRNKLGRPKDSENKKQFVGRGVVLEGSKDSTKVPGTEETQDASRKIFSGTDYVEEQTGQQMVKCGRPKGSEIKKNVADDDNTMNAENARGKRGRPKGSKNKKRKYDGKGVYLEWVKNGTQNNSELVVRPNEVAITENELEPFHINLIFRANDGGSDLPQREKRGRPKGWRNWKIVDSDDMPTEAARVNNGGNENPFTKAEHYEPQESDGKFNLLEGYEVLSGELGSASEIMIYPTKDEPHLFTAPKKPSLDAVNCPIMGGSDGVVGNSSQIMKCRRPKGSENKRRTLIGKIHDEVNISHEGGGYLLSKKITSASNILLHCCRSNSNLALCKGLGDSQERFGGLGRRPRKAGCQWAGSSNVQRHRGRPKRAGYQQKECPDTGEMNFIWEEKATSELTVVVQAAVNIPRQMVFSLFLSLIMEQLLNCLLQSKWITMLIVYLRHIKQPYSVLEVQD
ncbi:hypothetical protein Ancab_009961 [Ancistrocladus abbreviatus]